MLPFESAPTTDLYLTTCQDFETVLTSPFGEGQRKQLVYPRKISDYLFGQGMGGSELASGEGTKQWLEEMWQEAETS